MREPPVSMLITYKNICGASVEWLATGEGEMFPNVAKEKTAVLKTPTIPTGLMKKLARIAYTTYRDANIKLLP